MAAAGRATRTGFAHVWVDQGAGSRTIACQRPIEVINTGSLDKEALRRAKVLHLDGWAGEVAIEAARIVRRAGGTVVLDTGTPKANMAELLTHVDVVNCPQRFVSQFLETDDLERGAAALLAMGPAMVTVTCGAAGALLGTPGGVQHYPGHAVETVDTTGAGDVFCGALVHGVLSGWGSERMVRFATAAAAAKCRRIGNREALPTVRDAEALMRASELVPEGERV